MAKENKDLSLEERIAMMEKYHSGVPYLRDEAIAQVLDALDDYIYYMIHRRFAGYIGMIEDLAQSGRMAILEHVADYNPQYKLTTFFSFHIQNALQEVVNKENGESHYYAESKNIIVKTIRALGMDFDNIDEQVLAINLNMTTGRLHSILEKTLNKKKVELIEEDGETSKEYTESPESAFMKTEQQKEFRKCINQLDENEQIVLCMHFGFFYPIFNEMENTHKLSEIQKIMDKCGKQMNVINEYRSARRHIADIMYKEGLVAKRDKYQSAKDDIGLRFRDTDMAQELFDALNQLDGVD